ncbi:putative quinol monooxygenase [Rhodococcus sp. NPDC003382]|uniref:putative quinol monooxygenase n=1 Tax=unclassified Rhodococcus (in: high G+C Gram-positive bacteria) TaxID=192944 RepID=UPI0018CC8676|nr:MULTISPECIES: antibiotic biosynthesis monooxygenase [unclassified Rhodococcus (in: high G+C Gram-positive bacteria)]MBH0118663.1 antibiotic biosynthesis monooxygenase [Rhodococcus sp. CX]MCK8671099.1 antibiotic biosynthesis monooxygenase [Rhodococcus sp. HM1]
MSLTALLELEFKPDALDDAKKVMERVLGETREFDGCLGIEILVDKGNEARWVIVEKWQSEEHDTAYRKFRAGPGAITDLGPLLAGAPKLTHYNEL